MNHPIKPRSKHFDANLLIGEFLDAVMSEEDTQARFAQITRDRIFADKNSAKLQRLKNLAVDYKQGVKRTKLGIAKVRAMKIYKDKLEDTALARYVEIAVKFHYEAIHALMINECIYLTEGNKNFDDLITVVEKFLNKQFIHNTSQYPKNESRVFFRLF